MLGEELVADVLLFMISESDRLLHPIGLAGALTASVKGDLDTRAILSIEAVREDWQMDVGCRQTEGQQGPDRADRAKPVVRHLKDRQGSGDPPDGGWQSGRRRRERQGRAHHENLRQGGGVDTGEVPGPALTDENGYTGDDSKYHPP